MGRGAACCAPTVRRFNRILWQGRTEVRPCFICNGRYSDARCAPYINPFTFAAIFSAVKPKCCINCSAGALAPKPVIPMMAPALPT